MALVKMARRPVGKVFALPAVPKLDADGKAVVTKAGKVVMVNPEIEFLGLAPDSTEEEITAAYGGDAEAVRKAKIDAYNDAAFNAVRDPFGQYLPDGMTEEEEKHIVAAAKGLVTAAKLSPEAAMNLILSALK